MYGTLQAGSTGLPPSVPFEQPKNLFRYGEQTLWSTQLHPSGSALANGSFRLFTTPLGQVGQGFTNALSIGETSLKEGGRIPAGIAYDVFGIACQIGVAESNESAGTNAVLGDALNSQVAVDTLVNIQSNGVLSWDFTQTQVDIAPIELIGAGGGAFGSISIDNAGAPAVATVGNMNNGAGSVFLYRKHPVALPGNSTFSILLRYGSRASAISAVAPDDKDFFVKVVLLGYYKNVIEIG
jgi:hypothetical protein